MASRYAYDPARLTDMFYAPWKMRFPAFRVFGNLYFVGNRDGASWLLETDDGLVLFDTNYPTAAALLLDSIWSLGFDPRNIRAIFHTHGHFDHFGATELICQLSGAQTYLGKADAEMFRTRPELALIQDGRGAHLRIFQPDVEVEDGTCFQFGSTAIRASSCPGHSPGATSYFFPVTDGNQILTAGLHGGAGLNTLCRDFRRQWDVDWRQDFLQSIHKQLAESADIFLGNHTGQNQTVQKRLEMTKAHNPFIDRGAWNTFLTDLERCFQTMQEEEADR